MPSTQSGSGYLPSELVYSRRTVDQLTAAGSATAEDDILGGDGIMVPTRRRIYVRKADCSPVLDSV
jgi:hypothetical protein